MKQLLLSIALISATLVAAEDPKSTKDTKLVCVVSGDEIDKVNLKDQDYSKYKEGKVYFCCGGCKMDFDDAPNKFATKANFQLVATGQYVQTGCPVTGKAAGHNHHTKKDVKTVSVEGQSVDLCCAGCMKKYTKSNDKFSLLFSDKAYKKGFELASKQTNKTSGKKSKK